MRASCDTNEGARFLCAPPASSQDTRSVRHQRRTRSLSGAGQRYPATSSSSSASSGVSSMLRGRNLTWPSSSFLVTTWYSYPQLRQKRVGYSRFPSIWIFRADLEKNRSGFVCQRGENLARARDKPVQFEGQERSVSSASALVFWETHQRQEVLEMFPTRLLIDAAVVRQPFDGVLEGNRFLPFEFQRPSSRPRASSAHTASGCFRSCSSSRFSGIGCCKTPASAAVACES